MRDDPMPYWGMLSRALHWLRVWRGRGAARVPLGVWLCWTITNKF